jgi:hypothetical protein
LYGHAIEGPQAFQTCQLGDALDLRLSTHRIIIIIIIASHRIIVGRPFMQLGKFTAYLR